MFRLSLFSPVVRRPSLPQARADVKYGLSWRTVRLARYRDVRPHCRSAVITDDPCLIRSFRQFIGENFTKNARCCSYFCHGFDLSVSRLQVVESGQMHDYLAGEYVYEFGLCKL